MEIIPKISGVLRGNCCESCRNIPSKIPMKEFTEKKVLTRQMHFGNVCSNLLLIKEIFDEVAEGCWFVLFEVITYIS